MGSGHIFDIINRMKANRALRPSNRNKFKSNNREGIYTKNTVSDVTYNFPEISEAEMEKIKTRIREKARKEIRKQRILMLVIIVVLVAITITLFKL